MKLLDPFAGYRLASGHPVFHLAYFVGSWSVDYYKDAEEFLTKGPIVEVFHFMRWVHLVIFGLALVSGWADRPTNIPEANEQDKEDKHHLSKILHRDAPLRTFSRCLDTISVFLYQGAVFYAQWTLATSEQCVKDGPTDTDWTCTHFAGAEALWIVIETVSFYIYMLAATTYIMQFQLKSTWLNEPQSDITKSVKDFISYASINLTWYAFNFVLILLPSFLIFFTDTDQPGIHMHDRTGSYQNLMYWILGIHIFQFLFNSKIYVLKQQDDDGFTKGSLVGADFLQKAGIANSDNESEEEEEFPYRPYEREFYTGRWWVWVIQAISYIGITFVYIRTPGAELAYAVFIPLDLTIFIAMTCFYVYYFFQDRRRKQMEAQVGELIKSNMAQGIANMMRRNSAANKTTDPQDKQVLLHQTTTTENELERKKSKKLSKELYREEKEFGLGGDTYAMAFKAFNWDVAAQLELTPTDVWNAFQSALFVAGIQWAMMFFIIFMMVTYDTFQIVFPSDVPTLAARFTCTILMHLQVEADIRQGLRMMKYLLNHKEDFSSPFNAYMIGVLQMLGGIGAEVGCIFYLSSINTPMDVIIRFIALGSIAKVDDFYASALPDENRIKGKSKPMVVKHHRRDIQASGKTLGFSYWIGRLVFKFFRIIYASFVFYFMPYLILLMPYIVGAGSANQLTGEELQNWIYAQLGMAIPAAPVAQPL